MKKSQRDSQGRAIRWINTRSGKRHFARGMLFKRAMAAGSLAQSLVTLNAIKNTPATGSEELMKKAAILKAAAKAPIAAMKAFNSLKISHL